MLPRKMLSKAFVYNKSCVGIPRKGDVSIIESQLKPLKDGEFLTEAAFISVEPFSQLLSENFEKDKVVQGFQVAKVVESKNIQVPAGKYVVGDFGCRTHTISTLAENSLFPRVLSDIGKHPLSLTLGVLGAPGITAYFVLNEICKPQKDETVVISGASGVIGSISGQLAKRMGCRVLGITSSDDNGKWLKDTIGFDHYINHKTDNLSLLLDKYAPNGIDVYIDNVGGEISSTVIYKLNKFARIAVCGTTPQSNDKATEIQTPIKIKHAKMEGILASRWKGRWIEGMKNNLQLLNENKLNYVENVLEGFDKVPDAVELASDNFEIGKTVIKL